MNDTIKSDLAFKVDDADSYNDVAEVFDYYTQRFTADIAAYMFELVGHPDNVTALDVGTGSGIVALEIAQQVGDKSSVIGIDLSDGMLSNARIKAEQCSAKGQVDFLTMDAENLTFPDSQFDVIFSLYALRHFPNPSRALSEMYRVVKPGGKIVVAVGSSPPLVSLAGITAIFRKFSSLARRATGRELNACQFLDDLVEKHFPESQEADIAAWTEQHHGFSKSLTRMVKDAGFIKIQSDWRGQYSIIDSIEEFFLLQVTFSSMARKRWARADAADIDKLRAEFNRRCEAVLEKSGRLVYQTGAVIVSGMKSGY
jgi:ubiquinone/menaquinone biosynthesis C-methylase UbiE